MDSHYKSRLEDLVMHLKWFRDDALSHKAREPSEEFKMYESGVVNGLSLAISNLERVLAE